MSSIDWSILEPIEIARGEDAEETEQIRRASEEAKLYLEQHEWCLGIKQGFLGYSVGHPLSVFLFVIDPAPGAFENEWVIVGDVPSMYVPGTVAANAFQALKVFLGAMDEWVETVRSGGSFERCFSVAAEPTVENADALERRLRFIDEKILSDYQDYL